MIGWLIFGLIIVSSIGSYQTYAGSDSIVEIRIDPNFTYDNSTIIFDMLGNNKTFGEFLNLSLDYSVVNFGCWFTDPDFALTLLSPEDKVKFWVKPSLFVNLLPDEYLLLVKNLGVRSSQFNDVFDPGASYKIRVPRGDEFLFFQCIISRPVNLWNSNLSFSEVETGFYFNSGEIPGVPNATHSELRTTHEKLVITIHNLVWNFTNWEYSESVQRNNSITKPEQIEPRLGLYFNVSVSREGIWDLFNPNIK
jgi:hypothetical protein